MRSKVLNTPLGPLECRLRVDAVDTERSATLLTATSLEQRPLPHATDVEDGVVIMARLLPEFPIRQLKFEMRWVEPQGLSRPKPRSERGTNALLWKTDSHVAAIGTEDVNALAKRVQVGETMGLDSALYLQDLNDELDHLVFGHHDNGMSIRLTEIPARELIQLHFAVAWSANPEPVPDAAWYAIHRPHHEHTSEG